MRAVLIILASLVVGAAPWPSIVGGIVHADVMPTVEQPVAFTEVAPTTPAAGNPTLSEELSTLVSVEPEASPTPTIEPTEKPVQSSSKPAEKPSEKPAKTCQNRIEIAAVKIDNCLVSGGSKLTVPARATNNAAYAKSGNNTFIYGHNSSNIFKPLGGLKAGQKIKVTLGGETAIYTVKKAQYNFPYLCISGANTDDYVRTLYGTNWRANNCAEVKSMSSLTGSQGLGRPTITLMTCAGSEMTFTGSDLINGKPRREYTATARHLFVAVRD